VLLCLFAATASCAGAQNVTLKPLSPAEIQAVNAGFDKTLLPDGAGNIQAAGRQSFHVQIAGRTEVSVIPIRFSISEEGLVQGISRVTNECGVYLVDASGKGRFDRVADSDNAGLIQCGGVEGVGLAHRPGPHPQVILIFGAYTVHRSWSDPYLVSWSDSDGRYVVEELSAPAGASVTDKLTIAQVRSWVDRRP